MEVTQVGAIVKPVGERVLVAIPYMVDDKALRLTSLGGCDRCKTSGDGGMLLRF